MRVLHVVKGLGPGGAERLLVSLTAAAGPRSDVHVAYVLAWKSHLVAELEAAGARTHLLAGRRGLADLRWPLRLRSLVRELGPQVVHVHSPAVAVGARLAVRSLRGRPALVSTEHNLWPSFGRTTRLLNAVTAHLDDLRLAVSEEVRQSMWRRLRHDAVVLVHGVPVDALAARRVERTEARAGLDLSDDDVLAVTIANFREKKDYPTLLAAADEALRREPRLRFVAIGQGPLEASIRARHAELGLGDRFRFAGYQPDPARTLAAADLFVLTSRHEGLPIAVVEALALGVPVVASAVGGVPDVIRDDREGRLVATGDVAGFAGALVALAGDPDLRARYAASARDRAEQFDISRTAGTLLELYDRAARRHEVRD